jgi:hypothetical protein
MMFCFYNAQVKPRPDRLVETARMITGIERTGTGEISKMSATDAEKNAGDRDPSDIVDEVCEYLASLPKKDGLEQAIREGEQIAAIIEPLGLPPRIVAAVHASPLFRDQLISKNELNNNTLKDISRFVIGLQQLKQFSLPDNWQPGEALAVQQSEALR